MTNSKHQPVSNTSGFEQWVRPTATLDSFIWEEAPGLDKNLILELATCKFIAAGKNVIFSGPIASGKTHLANAISTLARQAGHSVDVVEGSRLDARFSWVTIEPHLLECDLLIIDYPLPTEQVRQVLQLRRRRATLLVTTIPAAELLQSLLPPTREFEPLRDAWADPVLVEFKDSTYGEKLRKQV